MYKLFFFFIFWVKFLLVPYTLLPVLAVSLINVHDGEREDIGELVHQSLVPVGHPDVGDVGPLDVVAGHPRLLVVGTEPVLLGVVREPGLEDGVTGDLTEVTA